MKERIFRFKQFSVNHSRSAMKVGVDGVLVGAWCGVDGAAAVLDAGCGCGLIALMCAQRNRLAMVTAVEVEPNAAAEAAANFSLSPWSDRLVAVHCDLAALECNARYDLIVSNPPFFHSGVAAADERQLARHGSVLSPFSLLDMARRLLSPGGRLSLILPAGDAGKLVAEGGGKGFEASRITLVRGHAGAPYKRALCEFVFTAQSDKPQPAAAVDTLTLNLENGGPTQQYLDLCHDFYLKF